MSNSNAKHDGNFRKVLLGQTDDAAAETRPILIDPITGEIKVTAVWNADAVDTDVTNFNRILSAADDDVQKALDTIDNNAKVDGLTAYHNLNLPEGHLINGEIVPSVASDNLTVAIKTLAGTDPSATDPVYIRLNNAIRTVSSALSVTLNAGTNWFNSGEAVTATKAIRYMVYLGYNATDGVTVGLSRITYASRYASFSTTNTNITFCAISTITNAAADDPYVVIGGFNATLSAGAGYTWTIPTFTNDLLNNYPIYDFSTLSFTPSLGYSGGTTDPTSNTVTTSYYGVFGKRFLDILINSTIVAGAGNRTIITYTIPAFTILGTAVVVGAIENITSGAGVNKIPVAYATTGAITVQLLGPIANDGTIYIHAVIPI